MAQSGEGWLDETRSAYLYRVIAEVERGSPRSELFRKLANEAEGQAAIWAKNAGLASVPAFVPDLRTRIVAGLVRRYGPRSMRGILAAIKVRGLSVYSHAAPGHPAPTSADEVGKRHRGIAGGGNLRAAVFGINDGLVSNASLILGVAGASANNSTILLSGIAGLLAGAFSMAAGEYVSVRSQREMYEHQIGLERAELAEYPEEEAEELALIYAARGLSVSDAHGLARRTIANPGLALDTLAREELGLNPDELGSPLGAAASSFISFAAGALLPLLPYLIAPNGNPLATVVSVTGVALFGVGATLSLFTGRSALYSGARMLVLGAIAGGMTFAIGHFFGVALG